MPHDDESTQRIHLPPHDERGVLSRLASQETSLKDLKTYLREKFTDISNHQRENSEVLQDIHDRMVRMETKMEMNEGSGPHSSKKNPMNKTVGQFASEILMAAAKLVGVSAVAALLVIAFKAMKSDNFIEVNQTNAVPPPLPPNKGNPQP
jgi:hypothetical protein